MAIVNHSYFDQQINQNILYETYRRCNFSRAVIGTSRFSHVVFEDCNFTNTFARGVEFTSCTFINCNFEYTYMRGAKLDECVFTGCSFNNTDMQSQKRDNCTFEMCEWRHVDFGGCTIGEEWIRQPDMLLVHGDGHTYKSLVLGYYPASWNHEWLQVGCSIDTIANWKYNWEHNKDYIYRQSDVAKDWADKYLGMILGLIDD